MTVEVIHSFLYNARITNVVDGDTFDANIDMGFSLYKNDRLRLYGFDTAEKNSKDPEMRAMAAKATEFVKAAILNKEVIIRTHKNDKYGRLLAEVFYNDEAGVQQSVGPMLLQENLAKVYL